MTLVKNTKILKSKGFWNYGIPAGRTCPKAGACAEFCYAKKGNYTRFPTVKKAQMKRFKHTLSSTFVDDMIKHIKAKRTCSAIRIHDSGDFYHQSYLNKWTIIALNCPEVKFYCYTKSLHLNWKAFDALPNTKKIQSEGGKLDEEIDYDKPHARIFNDTTALLSAGYVDCSVDDSIAANPDTIRVGLVVH